MAKEKEEDQKTSLVSTQLIQSLPEADKAQALEKLFPGATSRFFELIAEEGNHRKAVEVKTIENEEKKAERQAAREAKKIEKAEQKIVEDAKKAEKKPESHRIYTKAARVSHRKRFSR